MTAYPAWTPASRPGIVPLHPLSFGTILGRSFTALRHNPRVLLGFALVVQSLAYIVVIAAVAGIAVATYSRLDNVSPESSDYDTILAGSTAVTMVSGFVLGLAAAALGTIVQGVVVTDAAYAVLAERPTLRVIWRRVRPVAWRLIGYAFLLSLALILAFGVVAAAIVAIGIAVPLLAILLTIGAVLGAIVVVLWLSTKLLLVPATIILEHAPVRTAIARSWRLTRGRFWSTLGILVVIQVIFGALAQVISIPFSILGGVLSTVIAPTGDAATGSMVSLIVTTAVVEILALLISAVSSVVQATAAALIYVDCRMRHEGLDLDLLSYVEQRDAGMPGLADPYTQGIGRLAVRPVVPQYAPAYGVQPYAPPTYGQPADGPPVPPPYGQPAYGQPPYGQPAVPAYGQPIPPPYGQVAPPYGPPPAPPAVAPPARPAAPQAPPAEAADPATRWAPPGGPADGAR